ncbi:hypothetical protein [Nocardioides sp.]|uniref:hypothetical protein n=1 Tax=Nocardioides sp. TaxID=35761 RepID=UPI0035619193
MSAGKAKGTRHESAIVAFLQAHGFTYADRVPLSGSRDRGDVTVGPGSPVIEAKNQARHSFAEWLDEANQEAANARAPFGVVWAKRRGKGSVGDGYVVMDGNTFALLLQQAGYSWEPPLPGREVA